MFYLPGRRFPGAARGFTLLELMVSIFVVAIIAAMLVPVFTNIQARLERAKCTGNLRSLHVAANLYVQDQNHWPQVPKTLGTEDADVGAFWIDTFKPYGLDQINWICPTVQHAYGGPDLSLPENRRVDYFATKFDTNPQSPFRYSTLPWFADRGSHGNGNLMIFPDGHIESLNEVLDHLAPAK